MRAAHPQLCRQVLTTVLTMLPRVAGQCGKVQFKVTWEHTNLFKVYNVVLL
mgnify:CR=1 FL=1